MGNRVSEGTASGIGRIVSNRRGFSLMELLVVVSILGIVAIIALPRLGLVGGGDGLSASATRIVGLISRVRSNAVQSGKAQILYIDSGNGRLWFKEEAASKYSRSPKTLVELPESVRLRSVTVAEENRVGDGPVQLWVSSQGLLRPLLLELADGSGQILRLRVHSLFPKVDLIFLDPDGRPSQSQSPGRSRRHS